MIDGRVFMRARAPSPPSPRHGRSRGGAARHARAARATRPRPPAGTARHRRAAVAPHWEEPRGRRSETRARPSPRRSRDVRASVRGSRRARRAGGRARLRRSLRRGARRGSAPWPQRRRARRPNGSQPRSRPSSLLPPCCARLLRVQLVRLYDPLHELVPDDVFVAEANEGDPVDRAEDVLHVDESGRLLPREVDLRHVAGDDDPRAEAEARQEHLHLLRARVLRLVEDDERVVQRPAPHVRERRNLDGPTFHVRVQPLRVEHVVERVEERPQIRVDLGEQVAREEAEPLARFDGRTREDDARDLPLLEGCDGERHREIRLARARGADPEGDRAVPNRVDVALLCHRLRGDLLAAVPPDDVAEDVLDALGLVERLDDGVDRRRSDLLTRLDQFDELLDDGARLSDAHVLTVDRQPVPSQKDVDLQPVAQRIEDAVADRGELRRDVVRNVEHLLRQASFSFTSWLTTDPSALPETCGITSAPRRRLAAPTDKETRAWSVSPPGLKR